MTKTAFESARERTLKAMTIAKRLAEQSSRSPARGLKDHEISELVNAVRDAVAPVTQHQCSRELISRAVVNYLKSNGLKIDSV